MTDTALRLQIYTHDLPDGQVHYLVALAEKKADLFALRHCSLSDSNITLEFHRSVNDSVNEEYALQYSDLGQPVLYVEIDGGFNLLIDGHHRVRKALLTGVDVLPCKLLPKHVADTCKISDREYRMIANAAYSQTASGGQPSVDYA